MSSFTWDQGLIIKASSWLIAYEPDKFRKIRWYDDAANSVSLEYTLDSNHIRMQAIVDGVEILIDSVPIETEEWNGTDGQWHELSIEIQGNELYGLRDEKVLFELTDNRVANFTHTGFLQIYALSAQLCFDDVVIMSLYDPPFICGDANNDTSVNVSDAVSIINYVFVGGAAPNPYEAGDANCDATVNVSDAVWIINYVFVGGNSPCDTDSNGIPDC